MPPNFLIFLLFLGIIVFALVAGTLLILAKRYRPTKTTPSPKRAELPTNSSSVQIPPPVATEPSKFIVDSPTAAKSGVAPPLQALPLEQSWPAESRRGDKQEKIRILVVDDNVDTTENVSRLIYFEDDMKVIGQAYDGRQGIEMAIALRPHIVLMDINMPDIDGITATREMGSKAPYSQIIIMSVQADPQYMRQAMTAGARDFQPKPFTADELVSCIRRVYRIGLPIYKQIDAAQTQAKLVESQTPASTPEHHLLDTQVAPVVVVYSPKGGVGTSTIAAHLALAWQKAHGGVALMDGDLQFGDIMVHMNVHANRTIGDLVNLNDIDADIVSQVLLPHKSGLNLLLAPPRPETADLLTSDILTHIIKKLKTTCQTLVIDTNSQISDQTLAIFDIADYILVGTTPELTAVKSAKLLLDLLRELKFAPERMGVVINHANISGGIPTEQIKTVLKVNQLFHVPYDPQMPVATNRGESIYIRKNDAPSAQALTTISQDLWNTLTRLNEK